MTRLIQTIQFILRFAWNGSHKNNVRFPAYMLVRARIQDNPNIKQANRSR